MKKEELKLQKVYEGIYGEGNVRVSNYRDCGGRTMFDLDVINPKAIAIGKVIPKKDWNKFVGIGIKTYRKKN